MTKNITIAIDETLALETRIAAATAGKSVSRYIADMLREQIVSGGAKSGRKRKEAVAEKLMEIGRRASARPILDDRHPDDILYDEFGLPK